MRFFAFIATSLLASFTLAMPAPAGLDPRQDPETCDIKKCAAAWGPASVACAFSLRYGIFDPLYDLPCLALIIANGANVPAPCHGCEEVIKEKAPALEAKYAFLKERIEEFLRDLEHDQTAPPPPAPAPVPASALPAPVVPAPAPSK